MIEIRKISITELETDAVVNAANEGLRAGSGVCGAIFAAAGHMQLRAACAEIGHCGTGSAVITPEPEQLRGAYRRALELAKENGCASIGFPLISAGVFGYPVDLAWRAALRTCADFLEEGNPIDVVFAVLNDRILETGQRILQETAPHLMR